MAKIISALNMKILNAQLSYEKKHFLIKKRDNHRYLKKSDSEQIATSQILIM